MVRSYLPEQVSGVKYISPLRIGIGVEAERVECAYPSTLQASREIGFEREARAFARAGDEEARIGRIVGEEAGEKALVDLIAGPPDARADRPLYALAVRPQP